MIHMKMLRLIFFKKIKKKKTKKKQQQYFKMSSAAVVIGTLRVKMDILENNWFSFFFN